jgi:hypothetical protein
MHCYFYFNTMEELNWRIIVFATGKIFYVQVKCMLVCISHILSNLIPLGAKI